MRFQCGKKKREGPGREQGDSAEGRAGGAGREGPGREGREVGAKP